MGHDTNAGMCTKTCEFFFVCGLVEIIFLRFSVKTNASDSSEWHREGNGFATLCLKYLFVMQ